MTATAISPGYVDAEMSAWTRDKIPPEEMIRAGDIAELVLALSRLSRYAAIPNIRADQARRPAVAGVGGPGEESP